MVRFFSRKNVDMLESDDFIRTQEQQTLVVTKPKYFIGSSGTVRESHLMDIKRAEPSLYEMESPAFWQSKPFKSSVIKVQGELGYFVHQFDDNDLLLVTDKPTFQIFESMR